MFRRLLRLEAAIPTVYHISEIYIMKTRLIIDAIKVSSKKHHTFSLIKVCISVINMKLRIMFDMFMVSIKLHDAILI